MNALILDVATQIDRKVTVQMVLDSYGPEIFGLIMGVMVILLISVIHNVRAKMSLGCSMRDIRFLLRPQMSIYMSTMSRQIGLN